MQDAGCKMQDAGCSREKLAETPAAQGGREGAMEGGEGGRADGAAGGDGVRAFGGGCLVRVFNVEQTCVRRGGVGGSCWST